MKDTPLKSKSKKFALQIIKLSSELKKGNNFKIANQILKSGTSIGASIRESEFAQSKADLKSKLYIALKEANETRYWLELLNEGNILIVDQKLFNLLDEIIKMLVSSIKTLSK